MHESIGHNLPFLADLPGVKRPDDVLILLYLPGALAFGWWFRDVLRAHRTTLWCMTAAISCFALSAVCDLLSVRLEEWFELMAGLFIAAGLVALMAAPPEAEPPDPGPGRRPARRTPAGRPGAQPGRPQPPIEIAHRADLVGGPPPSIVAATRRECEGSDDDAPVHAIRDAAWGTRNALRADRGTRPGDPSPSLGRRADAHITRSRLRVVRRAEPHARAAAGVPFV